MTGPFDDILINSIGAAGTEEGNPFDDVEGLAPGQLSPNFMKREFNQRNAPLDEKDYEIHPELVNRLEKLRELIGNKPIKVNSGYRSPEYNKRVGGASKSQHMGGRAADIEVQGMSSAELNKIAKDLFPFTQTYDNKPHLHIDVRDVPLPEQKEKAAPSPQSFNVQDLNPFAVPDAAAAEPINEKDPFGDVIASTEKPKEKPIPELTAIDPDEKRVPLYPTPEEEAAMDPSDLENIKVIQEGIKYRRDIKESQMPDYTGPSKRGRLGAFMEGIIPTKSEEAKITRNLYPGATMAGKIAQLGLISQRMTGGMVTPITTLLYKTPLSLHPKVIPMLANAVQRSATWLAGGLIDIPSKEGKEKITHPLSEATFGFLLGGVRGVPSTSGRIVAGGTLRGLWTTASELIEDGIIDKEDAVNIVLNAGLGAAFEAVNAKVVSRRYFLDRDKNMRINMERVKARAGGKYTEEQADKLLSLVRGVDAAGKGNPAVVLMTEKIPLKPMTPEIQTQYAQRMIELTAKGLTVSDVMNKAGEWLSTKIPDMEFSNDSIGTVVTEAIGRMTKALKGQEGFMRTGKGDDLPEQRAMKESQAKTQEISDTAKDLPAAVDLEAFTAQSEQWFSNKEQRVFQSKTAQTRTQAEIFEIAQTEVGKKMAKGKAQQYDEAIQIYIDTKRDPESVVKFYDKLTDYQKGVVEQSQNLPPEIRAIADKMAERYGAIGAEALELKVIRNVIENYAGRIWDMDAKGAKTETFRKFGVTTRHAKQRTIPTIIEGWSRGMNLMVKGSTQNLQILEEEISRTIADKQFLNALKDIKIDGKSIMSPKQHEGYLKINHPNFKTWTRGGEIVEGETYAKNIFVTPEGDVYTRGDLYAPEDMAKRLNQVLDKSGLKGIAPIDFLTKYNSVFKSIILQSSFFHHLAFARSYYLGTNRKKWADMSFRGAYKQGLDMMAGETPMLMAGIKNGLTLGHSQEWSEYLIRQKSKFDRLLDKHELATNVRNKISRFREEQADFLFNKLGAGLKAKAFVMEYGAYLKEHPNTDPDAAAKAVAQLINNDFGGLNLDRLQFRSGFRNATVQHVFRLLCLAPDWTESNVRTVVDMFKRGKPGSEQEILTDISRKFWRGVLYKGLAATILANLLMSMADEDNEEGKGIIGRFMRNYYYAWKAGKLRWLDIDITPIYRALPGEKDEYRRYFSILGHFKDPIKFTLHPIRSAKHKGSVISKIPFEAMVGSDWAGRRYTTLPEYLGIDFDKGVYKTTRKGKYEKGDPKWGKLKGKTVTWDAGKKGPLEFTQIPSYTISQIKGLMPVQIQNLMGAMAGEQDWFDAAARSGGLGTGVGYGVDQKTSEPLDKSDAFLSKYGLGKYGKKQIESSDDFLKKYNLGKYKGK